MLEKDEVVNILRKIQLLLYHNSYFEAEEYINLEIDNLKEITPKKCKKTKYYFGFCDKCSNKNCSSNDCKK